MFCDGLLWHIMKLCAQLALLACLQIGSLGICQINQCLVWYCHVAGPNVDPGKDWQLLNCIALKYVPLSSPQRKKNENKHVWNKRIIGYPCMLDVQNIGPQIIPLLCRGQDRYVVVSRNREEWGIHNIFFLQYWTNLLSCYGDLLVQSVGSNVAYWIPNGKWFALHDRSGQLVFNDKARMLKSHTLTQTMTCGVTRGQFTGGCSPGEHAECTVDSVVSWLMTNSRF